MQISNKILNVQVVTSAQDMAQGLSGRDELQDDQGMLFDFGSGVSVSPSFWMKDMKFNLDLIWIRNNKIIGVTADVPVIAQDKGLKIKDSDLPKYSPPSPVDKVLEVNASWTEKNSIHVGDEVNLIKN